MGLKFYLPLALAVFLASTTGAAVVARTSIAGQPLSDALREHFYWAGVQFVLTMLLLAPFVVIAFICTLAEKHGRTRSVLPIFVAAMLALLYFYFQGHLAAERDALQGLWTASTLSVGLLPFFVGFPVVLAVMGAGALAAMLDRRTST